MQSIKEKKRTSCVQQFMSSSERHTTRQSSSLCVLSHLKTPLVLNVEVSQSNTWTPVFSLDILAISSCPPILCALPCASVGRLAFFMQWWSTEVVILLHCGQIQLFKLMCGAALTPSSHFGLGTCIAVPDTGDWGELW